MAKAETGIVGPRTRFGPQRWRVASRTAIAGPNAFEYPQREILSKYVLGVTSLTGCLRKSAAKTSEARNKAENIQFTGILTE